jgi:hypothetical protein
MQITTGLFKSPVLICTIPSLLKIKIESKFPVRQTAETQNQFKVTQMAQNTNVAIGIF